MLFPPDSIVAQRAEIMRDLQGNKLTEAEAGERILAVDPNFGAGYIFLANGRAEAGAFDEAESLYWKALEAWPCGASAYFPLADLRKRFPDDPLARELTILGMWKVALSDRVIEAVANQFSQLFPSSELDFHDPESFEVLAYVLQDQMEKMDPPPAADPRMRPFWLLNDLQREAENGLDEETLRGIIADPPGCVPILGGALREWARAPNVLRTDACAFVIAILGEISGPEFLDELLELIVYGDVDILWHANWAIRRLLRRFPEQTFAALRSAGRSQNVTERCAVAEQLLALPPDTPGADTAFLELLQGFEGLAKEEDAPPLLLAVTEGIRQFGDKREARKVMARVIELLPKKGRRWIAETLEDEGLVQRFPGIENVDIEAICRDRMLIAEEEDEDDEDEIDDDRPRPPAIRPGRNEPCWCGSGKKYKKCHLDSDEQAGRSDEEEPSEDEAPQDPLASKVYGDLIDSAADWHNRKDLIEAHRLFFDRDPADTDPEEAVQGGFLEWYVMEFRPSSTGRTVVEEYLRRRGPRLSEQERRLAEALRDVRFGFWESLRVEKNTGIELRNLFEDETIFVRDVSATRTVPQGEWLYGRIHRMDDRWQFSGNIVEVPRVLRAPLTGFIENAGREAGQTPAEYARTHGHIWERTLDRLAKQARKDLKIVNAEGDPLEYCSAVYETTDAAAVAASLRAARVFQEDPAGENTPEILHFGWLETGGEKEARRSYGHIEISGAQVRLECNSRKRLQIGRQLLEKHAGAHLRHLEDRFKSVEQAMEENS